MIISVGTHWFNPILDQARCSSPQVPQVLQQDPNDRVRPNHSTPPLTRAQYPANTAKANATLAQTVEDTESTDEDTEQLWSITTSGP